MERIYHQLVQGSPEWLIHRATHDNASDAAAMLNCNPHKSRNELLHERWLGMQPEFSKYAQEKILDRGHEFERLARPIAEALFGEDLFPVTVSLGSMSASLDGQDFGGRRNWEHKVLNATLMAIMVDEFSPAADLPKFYRVQMEHQFIAAGGEQTLFTASKWNGEDLLDIRHAWYFPDVELRAEIMAGWEQFHRDLEAYKPPEAEKPKPAGKRLDQLPALHVTVEGRLTESNLGAWKEHALSVISSVNRSLVTDEDFATAENMVKWCGNVESACDSATAYIRSQVGTIDDALKAVEDVKAEAAKVRIELKNLGDLRKKERKEELVADAVASFHKHTSDLNGDLAPYRLPAIAVDFAAQVKGKSKFANMKNDLDAELARGKIEANATAEKMRANIKAINEKPEFLGLFADAAVLIHQPSDHLALVIRTRIADHEAELKRKAEEAAEAARELIRAEERAKAEAAASEQARIEREAAEERAQAEREEQARIAKAEADKAAERRRQDEESMRERAKAEADLQKLDCGEVSPDLAKVNEPEPSPAQRIHESVRSTGLPSFEAASAPTTLQSAVASTAAALTEDEPANVSLGKIAECLGYRLSEEFIVQKLGIPWRRKERTACLWSVGDYELIRRAIARHALSSETTYIPF